MRNYEKLVFTQKMFVIASSGRGENNSIELEQF